ncbi:hypothetical protein GEMRC1_007451 [Eukaryota sp. GEM-RC1]
MVVKSERPSLEADRDHLIVSMANDKKQLQDFEDQILHLINTTDNVLDDDGLINTLNQSKMTSSVITERVKESEETEIQINTARESFRPMATRGSLLYFVITDLALVDNMYQTSLGYFNSLFSHVLKTAPANDDLTLRLESLIDGVTSLVYKNICRGLFERDKLTFSFLISTSILRNSGVISAENWAFFLKGPSTFDSELPKSPFDFIDAIIWESLFYLDRMSSFIGLIDSIKSGTTSWKEWIINGTIDDEPPAPWDKKLVLFEKLILVKVLKPTSTIFAISAFVERSLGKEFVQPPPFDLSAAFNDSTATTPLIFILSVGADPTDTLLKFAEEKGFSKRLLTRSLGQNQGPIAENYIQDARKSGDWVYLSNCHLAESWLSSLERIVVSLQTCQVHPDFRLWLSSMPAETFPVAVLQNGIKISNEPPKGLKANLKRTLAHFNQSDFENHVKAKPFKKLSFALAFFHALVQQRKSWGPTAFNIPYEISESDFLISFDTLRMFLEEQPEIPWTALQYLTAEVHYGGRFTDNQDRRCLSTILRHFYNEHALDTDYHLSESGKYVSPDVNTLSDLIDYVTTLPMHDPPEVFGLHANAAIAMYLTEAKNLLSTVVSLQPRTGGAGTGKTSEEIVAELADQILSTIPEIIDLNEAHSSIFEKNDVGLISALSTTLSHEILKYNKILKVVRSSLGELKKAIAGLAVMSFELDLAFSSLLNNQVPAMWTAVAYPSVKPLSSWIKDFCNRVDFFKNWLVKGRPSIFHLPSFSFPQGFLTSVLQLHARKYKVPIDSLSFRFEFLQSSKNMDLSKDGVYIDGLWMESGQWIWDNDRGFVGEADYGILYSQMPLIHFIPVQNYNPDKVSFCVRFIRL